MRFDSQEMKVFRQTAFREYDLIDVASAFRIAIGTC